MPASVVVCDLETVPDLRALAAANGFEGEGDDESRPAPGEDSLAAYVGAHRGAKLIWFTG